MRAIIYTDGACRSNNQRAAVGLSVCNEREEEVLAYSQWVGPATCNEAEYHALVRALQLASTFGVRHLAIRSDSQLMCNQINGRNVCKNDRLLILHRAAKALIPSFSTFSITHVRRALNQRADYLASQGLKRESGDPLWHWSCISL